MIIVVIGGGAAGFFAAISVVTSGPIVLPTTGTTGTVVTPYNLWVLTYAVIRSDSRYPAETPREFLKLVGTKFGLSILIP